MKIFFPLALAALLSLTYCSPTPPDAGGEPEPTENQGTAVEQDQLDGDGTANKQVSQMPDPNISPSQILKDNEAAYKDLHRTLKNNREAIFAALDASDMHEKVREALRNSYAEVIKYDNIYDIAKTSPQVSAETIVPYIKGLQAKLVELNVKLK